MNEFCVWQIYAKHGSHNVSRLISCGDNFSSIAHTKRTEANDDAIFCCRYCHCHCCCDCYLCCRHWYCFDIVFIHSSWRRRRSFLNVAYMHCAPLSDNNLGLTTLWCLIYKRILPACCWLGSCGFASFIMFHPKRRKNTENYLQKIVCVGNDSDCGLHCLEKHFLPGTMVPRPMLANHHFV